MSMKIVLIAGKKDVNEMMHRFDVFEESKTLAWPDVFVVEDDIPPENAGKVVENFRQAIEDSGEYNVVACFSPGITAGAFVKENVLSISNGKNWAVLGTVLKSYGYLEGE
jgi:hypothetical protein